MEQLVVVYRNNEQQDKTSTNLEKFLESYINQGYKVASITPTRTIFETYLQEAIIILEQ